MQSPYQNSGQGQYYGTPDGLGYLLARRNAENAAALENIGQFAGAVGAGIGGAVQAQNNPELMAQAFGAGKGSPAQAGLMNFAAAYGGGQSGFSGLKTSDNPAAGGMNFKQLAELGKAADSFRSALVASQPTVGDDEPDVFGKDEEWKTLGAREKFGRVQGFIQQNAEKAALQKMALLGQEMQMRQQAMTQNTAFGQAMSAAQGRINNAALAEGNGPVRTRPAGMADFAQVASPDAWASPQAAPFRELAAQGEKMIDPLEQFNAETRRMDAETNRKNAERLSQAGSRSGRDPYAEIDYREIVQAESKLEEEIAKARTTGQLDRANVLAGQLNRLKQRKRELRGGASPAVAPAAPPPGASRYTIIEE